MTENEIKEYVTKIRHKADIFRKSGFETTGIIKAFDKSADIIEELLPYMAIGTVEEFKALKEKEERFDRNIKMYNEIGLEIRAKAIDEFAEMLKEKYEEHNFDLCLRQNDYYSYSNSCMLFESYIDEIAEQMKVGGENE